MDQVFLSKFILLKSDIKQMAKDELRDYMVHVTHELGLPDGRYRYDATNQTWKHAFRLARLNGMENYEMDCNKCIVKIAEWLMK